MLGNKKIKLLEEMVKSLAISVQDLTTKVELLRKEINELKERR